MKYIDVPKLIREKSRAEAEALFSSRTKTAYLGDSRSICIILGKYKMFVDTSDIGFSPHMMLDGYWEYWLTKFISENVSNEQHVIDIGANLGYYSILLSEIVGPLGKVYSFEPNPAIFEMLKSTMVLNGFATRSELWNCALTGGPGDRETMLFIPSNDPKNATIVPEGYVDPRGRTVRVKLLNINDLKLKRADFIKIDVEGSEKSILESLRPLKEELQPKIVVEVNFKRNYGYDEIVDLVGYGNELLHIDFNAEVVPLTRKMVAEQRQGEDWLVFWPGKDPWPGR